MTTPAHPPRRCGARSRDRWVPVVAALLGAAGAATSGCGTPQPPEAAHAGQLAPSWAAYLEGTWCEYRSVWRDGSRSEDQRIEWVFTSGRLTYTNLRTRVALSSAVRVDDGRLDVSEASLQPTFQLEARRDGELRLHQAPVTFRRLRRGACDAPPFAGYRAPPLRRALVLDPPREELPTVSAAQRVESAIPAGGFLAVRPLAAAGCPDRYVERLSVCVFAPFLSHQGETECDRHVHDYRRGARTHIVTADGKLFVFQEGAPAREEGETFVDVPLLDEGESTETLSAPTYVVPVAAPAASPTPRTPAPLPPQALPPAQPAAVPAPAPASTPGAQTGSSPERNQVERFTNVDQP